MRLKSGKERTKVEDKALQPINFHWFVVIFQKFIQIISKWSFCPWRREKFYCSTSVSAEAPKTKTQSRVMMDGVEIESWQTKQSKRPRQSELTNSGVTEDCRSGWYSNCLIKLLPADDFMCSTGDVFRDLKSVIHNKTIKRKTLQAKCALPVVHNSICNTIKTYYRTLIRFCSLEDCRLA